MQIICANCGHAQEVNAPAIMGADGGKKSRRTISPEQQRKMQAAKLARAPRSK